MSQNKVVRAAAVQLSPSLVKASSTLDKVLGAIDDAAKQGAELIVFPETFIPYYPYFSFVQTPMQSSKEHMRLYEEAVVIPGPIVVVLGVNERDHGSLYNTQLVFDADGELILKRRKITPTFHERMIWGQGDASGLKVIQSKVARIGALASIPRLVSWPYFF